MKVFVCKDIYGYFVNKLCMIDRSLYFRKCCGKKLFIEYHKISKAIIFENGRVKFPKSCAINREILIKVFKNISKLQKDNKSLKVVLLPFVFLPSLL